MKTSDNKRIVLEFFARLTRGDAQAAMSVVADEVAWWVPGTLPFSGTKNKAEYAVIVDRIRAGFPDGLIFEVRGLTAEADRVAAEVESLGRHAKGVIYNNRYHFLFVLEAGRIVAVKEYMDTLHLHGLLASAAG